MQSAPSQPPSSDLSTASPTAAGAAAVSVACAHVVLAQLFMDSGDAHSATKHLISHLHMLLSPLGSHAPFLPPSAQRSSTLLPPSTLGNLTGKLMDITELKTFFLLYLELFLQFR